VRYNWQSDPKRPLDPEMDELRGVWKEGIKSAVDSHRSQVDEWRKQAKAADELEVDLFLEKEPATIPLGEAYLAKIRAKEAEEAARDKQQADLEALQSAYQARIEELSQKMMANMHDQALMQQTSDEMTRVVEEMQDQLQKLLKG
jgi:hypothetical protein